MNIGQASEKSGLPAKTIRYYEDLKLITPAREANGYRCYGEEDMRRLCFLRRSRRLGFSIQECRLLLSLYANESRASADVKAIAQKKIELVEREIDELISLRSTLKSLVDSCNGNEQPNCPILDNLAGHHD